MTWYATVYTSAVALTALGCGLAVASLSGSDDSFAAILGTTTAAGLLGGWFIAPSLYRQMVGGHGR